MVIFLSFLKRQIWLFFQGLVFVLMVLNQAGDFSMVLSASESTDGNRIKSLQLEPNEISLWGFNASQGFLLMGESAEGMRIDLTHQGSFSISNHQIARLDGANRIVALQDGVIILRAEFQKLSVQTKIQIKGTNHKRPFSFARDIGGILTKRGCNSNECHGSVKGKGGLKLSVNALYPKDDYRWIIQGGTYQVLSPEPLGNLSSRIDLKKPSLSLLLKKPTLELPHGGGERFSPKSADYKAILHWIQDGASYGEDEEKNTARIIRLEVLPREILLDSDGKQQLLVTAVLADGHREDLTKQVHYESNNMDVVQVDDSGLVQANNLGETAIIIRAAGYATTIAVGVIRESIHVYPNLVENNFIDHNIFGKLEKYRIIPSDLSNDVEFLRRVCLDLTGTLPPPEKTREFLTNNDSDKRKKLIETLLSSPEYVDYWTYRFADLFRVGKAVQGFTKYSRLYWEWIRSSIEQNKPYDQIARERISAQGFGGADFHYYLIGGDLPVPQDMMSEQIRVFLGRRLDCAQCHNHPYEPWSQNQFWGMTAFYGQLTRVGDINTFTAPYNIIFDDPNGHGKMGKGGPVIHPRDKRVVIPAFLNGDLIEKNGTVDPRSELAAWITDPMQSDFSEAIVNRIWGQFFGRGIVDPVDDFKLANPATHPMLLAVLAKDFQEYGYDLKHLMRRITRSQTYQLSSVPNVSNKIDRSNYSRSHPRPLDAEVLSDAISQVLEVSEKFGSMPEGTRAINLVSNDMYASRFLNLYGRPNRQMIPQRKVEASLGQALHFLAGPTYTTKLSRKGSRLDRLLEKNISNMKIIEEFYLSSLCRYPTQNEHREIVGWVREQPSRQKALEDVVWALITSREFAYVH